MQIVDSYVVRIYRKDRDTIAGLIEDVRTGKSRSFGTPGELWRALSGRRPRLSAEYDSSCALPCRRLSPRS